jgi:predicted P-loop ATPase
MTSPLIQKYGQEKRWVTWRLQVVKGKQTKVPYIATSPTRKASSTDPATWATASTFEASDNVGIVLHDGLLLCIDIDHVLTEGKLQSEHNETIAELILEADTYTEVSQSGTGLHLFIALTEPLELTANKKAPFEVYTKGRYICTTGKSYGEERLVRTVKPIEALEIINKIVLQKEVEKKSTEISTSSFINDNDLLLAMFASKNGKKIKDLFDGITDIKDTSSADSALCCHLAYWSGKDPVQMDRLLLLSELGKRDKMKRKDYRDRTIKAAINFTKDIYKPSATRDLDLLFKMTGKDKDIKVFTLNTENICRVISRHKDFINSIRYDTFTNKLEIKEKGTWREFANGDDTNYQRRISILFPFFGTVTKQMVYDAMVSVAIENSVDSAVDYLKSLTWDRVPRLDHWLANTYGVPDDEYHRAVASNWLKGLVKRIVVPGSKFDYVLVLEGEQGVKKSTSLGVLGGEWHVETTMSTDNKDFFMLFAGKAIIEFSEGETMSRTDVKRMKAIITTQNDRYRLPFARTVQDFKRRCVFAMTTNDTEYLKDETGNRRWLPVATVFPEANIEWLAENRDQLFAEAYHRAITLRETTYEFPKDETLEIQKSRMVHDPNEETIAHWYTNGLTDIERLTGVTTAQVYKMALHGGFNSKPITRYEEMMIAGVLKNHLKLISIRKMVDGVQANRWVKKEDLILSELQLTTDF